MKQLPNVSIRWGCKPVCIDETESGVTVHYEHVEAQTNQQYEARIEGDGLLGRDGIHSTARSFLVEPSRKPSYTGIAVAMAFTSLSTPGSPTASIP